MDDGGGGGSSVDFRQMETFAPLAVKWIVIKLAINCAHVEFLKKKNKHPKSPLFVSLFSNCLLKSKCYKPFKKVKTSHMHLPCCAETINHVIDNLHRAIYYSDITSTFCPICNSYLVSLAEDLDIIAIYAVFYRSFVLQCIGKRGIFNFTKEMCYRRLWSYEHKSANKEGHSQVLPQ